MRRYRRCRVCLSSSKLLGIISIILAVAIIIIMCSASGIKLCNCALREAEKKIIDDILSGYAAAKTNDKYIYDDYVSGRLQKISVSGAAVNSLMIAVNKNVAARVSNDDDAFISVHFGTLLGRWFVGKGPEVGYRYELSCVTNTSVKSEMQSTGINHTLYKIIMSVAVSGRVSTRDGSMPIKIIRRFVIAETMIIGDVPDGLDDLHL